MRRVRRLSSENRTANRNSTQNPVLVSAAMWRRGSIGAVCALAIAGCGDEGNQASNEPDRDYRLEVVSADFPDRQHVAERTRMRITVLNRDTAPVPNLAVTLKRPGPAGGTVPSTFAADVGNPGLADKDRPLWIVDEGPVGGEVAYASTWALGRLAPGQTKTFDWYVTAVQPGRHTVQYEVAPGLDGDARAVGKPGGTFTVVVEGDPSESRVRGDGSVVREGEVVEEDTDDDGSPPAEFE